MKTSQIFLSVVCVLAAILSECYSVPQWRPQGRFGKRTEHITAADDSSVPYFGNFHTREIPVEALFSKKDLANRSFRPVLCSTTGVTGYPSCDLASLEARDLDAVLDF
ncbi:hypothetical protein Btru_054686 [Bulinus truncatus]|nr:hypothetical protein Btru_054686 [Bulinus truncatus]